VRHHRRRRVQNPNPAADHTGFTDTASK
jgi:hypothetical protein